MHNWSKAHLLMNVLHLKDKTTNPRICYDNKDLFRICELMLKGKSESNRDSYTFDVVNIGRQVLSNYLKNVRDEFTVSYEKKDRLSTLAKGDEMMEILSDLDLLLTCHNTFSFGRWIRSTEAFGKDPAEKEYYKKNVRTILTTWVESGQSLSDYANRSWSGMTNSYYARRWDTFIREVYRSLENGSAFDEKRIKEKMLDLEADWAENNFVSSNIVHKDGLKIAESLMIKYKQRII